MAFQSGVATSQEDLIQKLFTFLTANGWVQDELDTVADDAAIHDGAGTPSVYVQFRWDNANGIALFHSQAFVPATNPGSHTNDSGNGDETGNVDTERRINVDDGPYISHAFFTDGSGGSPGTYAHVVLEFAPGQFRHFSFGKLVKIGDWTGGDYVAAHYWDGTQPNDLQDARHNFLLDGRQDTDSSVGATVHLEGFPGQPGAGKYGVVWNGTSAGNDGDGNARESIIGGLREGFWMNALGWLRGNPNNGFVPLIPITLYHRRTSTTPDQYRKLGDMPDARYVNVFHFATGEEFTVGSDTWKVYPWTRKNNLQAGVEGSGNLGIAYKKI